MFSLTVVELAEDVLLHSVDELLLLSFSSCILALEDLLLIWSLLKVSRALRGSRRVALSGSPLNGIVWRELHQAYLLLELSWEIHTYGILK